jgi:succinyl-CoA synthetase alpha subunit
VWRRWGITSVVAIMEECGFTITRNPSEMGRLLKGLL